MKRQQGDFLETRPTKKQRFSEGSVIGKAGSIIRQIRQDTGAKIRIAEGDPHCRDRVIVVAGSIKERQINSTNHDGEGEKETLSPALQALLRVADRLMEGEGTHTEKGTAESHSDGETVTMRLVVPSNQVGCVLGKRGNIIQRIRTDSGAQIRVC